MMGVTPRDRKGLIKKGQKRNEKEKSLDSSLGAKVLCSKDLDLYQKLGKGKKIDLAESC